MAYQWNIAKIMKNEKHNINIGNGESSMAALKTSLAKALSHRANISRSAASPSAMAGVGAAGCRLVTTTVRMARYCRAVAAGHSTAFDHRLCGRSQRQTSYSGGVLASRNNAQTQHDALLRVVYLLTYISTAAAALRLALAGGWLRRRAAGLSVRALV